MSSLNQIIHVRRNKKISKFLLSSKDRINLLVGSAGSGKSWSIAQHLILDKAMNQPRTRTLITRTTGPALKKSCWLLTTDLLNTYEVDYKTNLSDFSITLFNKAQMFFVPLDDVNKLKSIERINYIWAEEATQLSHDEYRQLDLRTRGENPYGLNQLYFSFNPDDENSFLKPLCEHPPEGVAVCHSTYQDNAFNSREYVKAIEKLKDEDPTYWKIYGQGIWATPRGMIYSNWDVCQSWPYSFDEVIHGIDFGYNNPSVLLEIGIKDKELYVREVLYATGLTNQDFISTIGKLGINKNDSFYADSSEPDRIMELESDGFNIWPCRKGKNSVFDGIDMVKRMKIHIHEDSQNLLKELRAYKWKEDRNGNIIDGEPVKFNDHAMDALRYACFTHFGGPSREVISISSSKSFADLGIL